MAVVETAWEVDIMAGRNSLGGGYYGCGRNSLGGGYYGW